MLEMLPVWLQPLATVLFIDVVLAGDNAIVVGMAAAGLPADRGELFDLLQSMEKSGGWPYIPRLQLRTFMDLLQHEPSPDGAPDDESLAA